MQHALNICHRTADLPSRRRQQDRNPDAAQILADEFLASPFNCQRYAHWPLDRQLHAFLADGNAAAIDDYECAYTALYAKVLASRGAAAT
jgi:hypothetical protein